MKRQKMKLYLGFNGIQNIKDFLQAWLSTANLYKNTKDKIQEISSYVPFLIWSSALS